MFSAQTFPFLHTILISCVYTHILFAHVLVKGYLRRIYSLLLPMSLGDWTWVIRAGSKYLYPLRLLIGPQFLNQTLTSVSKGLNSMDQYHWMKMEMAVNVNSKLTGQFPGWDKSCQLMHTTGEFKMVQLPWKTNWRYLKTLITIRSISTSSGYLSRMDKEVLAQSWSMQHYPQEFRRGNKPNMNQQMDGQGGCHIHMV